MRVDKRIGLSGVARRWAARLTFVLGMAAGAVLLTAVDAIHARPTSQPEVCELTGSVRLQGRVGHGGTRVSLGHDVEVLTGVGGSFSAVLPAGVDVRVRAAQAGFLTAETATLACLAGGSLRLAQVQLKGGDTNRDQKLDLLDLVKVSVHYGSCEGDATFDRAADLDRSDCVDIFDLVVIGANYGMSSPLAWPVASGNFESEVLPILELHCRGCHGDQGGLRLDSYAGVMAGGRSGPSVVAGDPEGSLLYRRVSGLQGPAMPPGGVRLSASEIRSIRTWIESGAP